MDGKYFMYFLLLFDKKVIVKESIYVAAVKLNIAVAEC